MQWTCHKCGAANEELSGICSSCLEVRSIETAAVPANAASTTPTVSQISSGAGFGIRFLARFIDLVYGFILGLFVGVVAGITFAIMSHLGVISSDWPQQIRQHTFTGFGLSTLGAFLYTATAEGFSTITIGKLICGLRVVHTNGTPVTMKGALMRDLAYHWDALFFGLIGLISMEKGPLKQRYGDVWAKTAVVKKSVFQPQPGRSPARMFAGILMGSLLWAGLLFLVMVLKVM